MKLSNWPCEQKSTVMHTFVNPWLRKSPSITSNLNLIVLNVLRIASLIRFCMFLNYCYFAILASSEQHLSLFKGNV